MTPDMNCCLCGRPKPFEALWCNACRAAMREQKKVRPMPKKVSVLPGHAWHSKTDDELRFIIKDASEAAHAMMGVDEKAEGKYIDQVSDAHSILAARAAAARVVEPGHIKVKRHVLSNALRIAAEQYQIITKTLADHAFVAGLTEMFERLEAVRALAEQIEHAHARTIDLED